MLILDLIGTFAFAAYGANKAIARGYNVFGVMVCASLVALGGGTIRELLLQHTPFYFYESMYMWAILIAVVLSFVLYPLHRTIRQTVVVLDAIGLATFAYIGAYRADEAGLGLVAMVAFATLTAAGGGVLCDIALNRTPASFKEELYAVPAIVLAVAYFIVQDIQHPAVIYALLTGTFLLRCAMLRSKQLYGRFHKLRHIFLPRIKNRRVADTP